MQNSLLKNEYVTVRPMTEDDVEAIYDVALHPEIWTYSNFTISTMDEARQYVQTAMTYKKNDLEWPYVIIDPATDKIVGSTRFYHIDLDHRRVELGYTWITPAYWQTAINTNAKLLLLSYCFEELNLNRVQIVADERNTRSCKAIERIGAIYEGVLRQNLICRDGYIRNTAVYSILLEEWPTTKNKLIQRIKNHY